MNDKRVSLEKINDYFDFIRTSEGFERHKDSNNRDSNWRDRIMLHHFNFQSFSKEFGPPCNCSTNYDSKTQHQQQQQ